MPEFYHVLAQGQAFGLQINQSSQPFIFFNFLHNTLYPIWTTPSSIAGIPRCVCTHLIDPMGIHLLCCAHNNECTKTHDAICDTFVAIAWDVNFHVGRK